MGAPFFSKSEIILLILDAKRSIMVGSKLGYYVENTKKGRLK